MTTWFTSDTHFGHARIIEYCNRPFYSVAEMNAAIVASFAEIQPGDTLYHLGDVALGGWKETIKHMDKINGTKILLPGNHDPIHPIDNRHKREDVWTAFHEVFDEVLSPHLDHRWTKNDVVGTMSHFPMKKSETDARHNQWYAEDSGQNVHIHGHVHNLWKVNRSQRVVQVNVGWDVWHRPVSWEEVLECVTQ